MSRWRPSCEGAKDNDADICFYLLRSGKVTSRKKVNSITRDQLIRTILVLETT